MIQNANEPTFYIRDIATQFKRRADGYGGINLGGGLIKYDTLAAVLNELADRREKEELGECWNCHLNSNCDKLVGMKSAGLIASYCADKKIGRHIYPN